MEIHTIKVKSLSLIRSLLQIGMLLVRDELRCGKLVNSGIIEIYGYYEKIGIKGKLTVTLS